MIANPIFAALLWTIFKPWSGWSPVLQVAVLSILLFVALWGVIFLVCLFQVPSQLESEQAIEHEKKTVRLLAQQSARKHPHDEHLEARVREEMGKLDERQKEFVRYLMDHTQMNNNAVHMAGFSGVPDQVMRMTQHFLVTYESVRPGNGLVERDRLYRINPAALDALRHVLYSPLRPVTPPTL